VTALEAVLEVQRQVAALQSGDLDLMTNADAKLREMGEAAVPALISVLEHSRDTLVCVLVADILEDLGTPQALRAVRDWEAHS